MFFKRESCSTWASGLLTISLGATLFFISVSSVAWWSAKSLYADTAMRIDFARNHLDIVLGHAEKAASETQGLIGQTCSRNVVAKLKQQVIFIPNVRSITLANLDKIYCSSFYGSVSEKDSASLYAQKKLLLLRGDSATPNLPVLFYRNENPQGAVIVGVDGYFIANTLDVIHTLPVSFFKVGKNYLTSSGEIVNESQLPIGKHYATPSSLYPYVLIAITSQKTILNNIIKNYRGSLLCCLLATIIASIIFYRWLRRPLSPIELLRNGIIKHEFTPFIQPIIDITTRKIKGGEILMRWIHPRVGTIPPDQFIPLAESSGLIIPMTRTLISDTSNFFSKKENFLPENFHIGFNITQEQLQDENIISDCQRFLSSFKSSQVELVLELIERNMAEDSDNLQSQFNSLRQMGVKFALDDFGTGYSTHAYIQKFNIDYIKIDQSFIQMIGVDRISGHIVDNVISLADGLGLKVIAEGVETEEQEKHLKKYNVQYLQGYRYGKPMPLAEFVDTYLTNK